MEGQTFSETSKDRPRDLVGCKFGIDLLTHQRLTQAMMILLWAVPRALGYEIIYKVILLHNVD